MQHPLGLTGPSGDVVDWLLSRAGGAIEPLFRTNDELVVHTGNYGSDLRPVLCRHPRMERAMITIVEEGLRDPSFAGILYVMGWGNASSFRLDLITRHRLIRTSYENTWSRQRGV